MGFAGGDLTRRQDRIREALIVEQSLERVFESALKLAFRRRQYENPTGRITFAVDLP